jgi:hypothetical protein
MFEDNARNAIDRYDGCQINPAAPTPIMRAPSAFARMSRPAGDAHRPRSCWRRPRTPRRRQAFPSCSASSAPRTLCSAVSRVNDARGGRTSFILASFPGRPSRKGVAIPSVRQIAEVAIMAAHRATEACRIIGGGKHFARSSLPLCLSRFNHIQRRHWRPTTMTPRRYLRRRCADPSPELVRRIAAGLPPR